MPTYGTQIYFPPRGAKRNGSLKKWQISCHDVWNEIGVFHAAKQVNFQKDWRDSVGQSRGHLNTIKWLRFIQTDSKYKNPDLSWAATRSPILS